MSLPLVEHFISKVMSIGTLRHAITTVEHLVAKVVPRGAVL